MKQYTEPNISICIFEEDSDVITTSIGTSNDNNYSDIDWS